MKDAWKLLLVLAVALIAGGMLAGYVRTIYAGARDCGTALTTGYAPQVPACNQALSDGRVLAWVLVGAGVVVAVTAEVLRRRSAAST